MQIGNRSGSGDVAGVEGSFVERAATVTPESPALGTPPMTAEHARVAVAARAAELSRRLEAAAGAREQLAAVRGRSTSDDGLVSVEVSARGTLLDLTLAAGASPLPPDRLAALILRTARRATTDAALQVRAVLEPTVAPGTDLDALVIDPAVPADAPEVAETGLAPHGSVPAADEETGEPESWLRPAGARAAR